MVGTCVQYTDAGGVTVPALVLHEYPHDPATKLESSRFANLAIVDPDGSQVGPFGRFVRIVQSVPHADAPKLELPVDSKGAPDIGFWKEA